MPDDLTDAQNAALAAAVVAAAASLEAFRADNAAYAALQAEYDQYRQDHPDTPPPSGSALMVGVTKQRMAAGQPWDIIRVYNDNDAARVPAGMVIAHSLTDVLSHRPGWSSDQAMRDRAVSSLRKIRDDGLVHRVCAFHEPEDNYGYTADAIATYLDDERVFRDLVDDVNADRHTPLLVYRCFIGGNLTDKNSNTDLRQWAVNPDDYDELGVDVYGPNQIHLSVDFADEMGKPLVVPEMGPMDNVEHTDPAILEYMQDGIPAYRAQGAAWVCWFDKDGAGADLDQYPDSLAYWTSQTTALAGG